MSVDVESVSSGVPSRGRRRLPDGILTVLLPAACVVAVILLWAAIVEVFDIGEYLLPSPWRVWEAATDNPHLLWEGLRATGKEVIVGFALAVVIAIPLGVVLAESALVRRVVYPLLVGGQIIPKVAIAPLFVVWFGLGMTTKIVFVVLMSFFPIVVNTMVGVASASAEFHQLAQSVGLRRTATLWKVTLPQALPSTFGGLKVGMTLAVIGAVVAEFITSQSGLGYLVLVAQGQVDTPLLFAAILVLTLMGLVLYGVVALVERLITPAHRR